MKTRISALVVAALLPSAARAGLPSFSGSKAAESLEACLIRNSHRHLKDQSSHKDQTIDGKDKVYTVEELAWKDCRQGRALDEDPWLASEVQIVRAKVRMQLTWELMNEHGA